MVTSVPNMATSANNFPNEKRAHFLVFKKVRGHRAQVPPVPRPMNFA